MTTLTKNLFVHAEGAKPGVPAIPAYCFDDGSATSLPDPGGNPIKWDKSGVGTGTGRLPKYAFGLPTVIGGSDCTLSLPARSVEELYHPSPERVKEMLALVAMCKQS
jgi:hypothetical protein